MNTQPTALRLADLIQSRHGNDINDEAAAELRRLHVHERLLRDWLDRTDWVQETARPHELGMHRADVMLQRLEKAEAQRDALLEALRFIAEHDLRGADLIVAGHIAHAFIGKARAAIKAVEGEKT